MAREPIPALRKDGTTTRRPDRAARRKGAGTVQRHRRTPSVARRPWAQAWLLVPFGLALLWRLAYLQRLAHTPLANTLRGDEQSYWDWAGFLLGHSFVGTNAFFQGPLYPYVLAVLRSVVGSIPDHVLVAQAIWGAAAVALLADVIRRSSGPAVALVVGSVLAVNTMWVFFDGLVLSESLLLFLESFLLWAWSVQCQRGPQRSLNLIAALTIGLLAQGRATAAVLLIPHVFLVRDLARARSRAWIGEAALAIGAFLLTVVPSTLWNYSRTHAFMPFTYNSGINLYIGNNPRADGRYAWVDGARLMGTAHAAAPDGGAELDSREFLAKERGLNLNERQSSDYWTRRAVEYAEHHPGETAKRAADKVLLMLNRLDSPQIEHVGTFQELAGPVGAPVLGGFLLLAVMGLAGMPFASRWGALGRAARSYVVVVVLATTPFFVTDRYRIHLVPALAVLAGLTADRLGRVVRERATREAMSIALAVVVAVAVTCLPLGSADPEYERWLGTSDLGLRWLEAGDATEAARTFREAVRQEAALSPEALSDPDVSKDRANMHFNYGVSLRAVEGNGAALPQWEAAAALDPSNARYLRTLSDAYRLADRARAADSLLALAGRRAGGDAEVAVSEGFRAARDGRYDDAERDLERAVAQDARLYGAWGALIRVRVIRKNLTAADSTLRRAEAAGMPSTAVWAYEGLLAAENGNTSRAQLALKKIEGSELDPSLEQVKRWTRDLLGEATDSSGSAR